MGEHFICEARRYGDKLYCGRCDLVSAPNAELVCKTAKECGLVLSALCDGLADEAERIEGSIIAAVAYADLLISEGKQVMPGPSRDRLRRVAELRGAVRALDAYKDELRKRGGS